jgi:hypothetical protein
VTAIECTSKKKKRLSFLLFRFISFSISLNSAHNSPLVSISRQIISAPSISTNFPQQIHSWEDDIRSAGQKSFSRFSNRRNTCRVHKIRPLNFLVTTSDHISLRSILMLLSHKCLEHPSSVLIPVPHTKIIYLFLLSSVHATCQESHFLLHSVF